MSPRPGVGVPERAGIPLRISGKRPAGIGGRLVAGTLTPSSCRSRPRVRRREGSMLAPVRSDGDDSHRPDLQSGCHRDGDGAARPSVREQFPVHRELWRAMMARCWSTGLAR